MQTVTRKAQAITKSLDDVGLVGIDFNKIMEMLVQFISMFAGCLTAPQVQKRTQKLASGQWYVGRNLDVHRLDAIIEESGCCDGTDVDPAAVQAAIVDAAGDTTTAEYKAMFEEVRNRPQAAATPPPAPEAPPA